jgi:hypothetical protein
MSKNTRRIFLFFSLGVFVLPQGPLRGEETIPFVLRFAEAALRDKRENRGTVFTINGSTLSQRSVGLGRILGDEREISSGLAPGEVVVLRPDAALQDGIYVSITD